MKTPCLKITFRHNAPNGYIDKAVVFVYNVKPQIFGRSILLIESIICLISSNKPFLKYHGNDKVVSKYLQILKVYFFVCMRYNSSQHRLESVPQSVRERKTMNRKPLIGVVWILLLCILYSNSMNTLLAVMDQESIAPLNAPFEMPELKRPVFPDRIVSICQYGAVGDGITDNSKAFEKAISTCAQAGGGRVLVPAGQWYTGSIHLKSNIELHLAEGSEIIFSDWFEDYLPVVLVRVGGIEIYNYSPLIYARDCENVAVTGPGKLNGNAQRWWDVMRRFETKEFFDMGAAGVPVKDRVFGTPEAAIRPSFLCLMNCRNVLLEGFTIGSGPNWTIHPIYCENVIIRRVDVITDGPNNDGIDPDSCRNVLIEYCTFDTGDDCVVLKSGYNEDGWRVGRPTENVVMRYCSSKRGHGGLVIGSEMSGDVRNVYMHDCTFEGTDRAIRVKSKRGRGGVVENVWARDLNLKDMQREAVIFNMAYGSDRKKASNEKAPIFRNFDIRNLTCLGAPVAIRMQALEDAPIENIYFENVRIASGKGVICKYIQNVKFKNMTITPKQGPVYQIAAGRDVVINKGIVPAGTDVFLEVSGDWSDNIVLKDCKFSNADQEIVYQDGAVKEAVRLD